MTESILYTPPAFIAVLSLVVFIHEMGHYLVGRWCGVGAKAFSVGFGPELLGWNDKNGTRWKICLIPLGGYVKFNGDMNPASQADPSANAADEGAVPGKLFQHARLWQRALIVLAGPIANFILAFVIFSSLFYTNGRMVMDPVVSEVMEDGAAKQAGIQADDIIRALDGEEVATFSQVQRYVSVRAGEEIVVTVERGGRFEDIAVTPRVFDTEDAFGNPARYGLLGVRSQPTEENIRRIEFGAFDAVTTGASETVFAVSRTFTFLGELIVGKQKVEQLGGPLRIARMSGQVATLGFAALLSFVALLSVSIGILNLLPIPMLDGGHLAFYAVEALRGKPLGEQATEWAYRFGFACVFILFIVATSNDVMLFTRQISQYFAG